MEYVYAAMLLHSAGKEIDDDAVSAVLKAAGVDVDAARVKALVASLSGVDIAEAMATAVAAPAAAAPAAAAASDDAAPAAAEEEEEEDDGGGFEGLGSLFG
ncbi:MAG: 50S ribosomal protein P1 [Euryarchaeota archaeon]|jgi:large subunit ribosomal protein L12|nr:50S ribosomal protein P1 [Euryarchaeota archaeon]MCH2647084.1 50S ribosomal protein P1 [Candidatus Poseidoniaceae archaeon]DAC41142.1 MAG TPA: 50S ribosomal protein P1 [Candidatus Poseidoniales archaeon]HIH57068.1 50S ribosomal protein P1 [Candidatus Poseidoniaceae archaeon]|tara:strand:- start:347 stop:649 length:303 start_codon:yes stop_codon:yes gene_type:complete